MGNSNAPKTIVGNIESQSIPESGNYELFAGYGVMGLPFKSEHILALRRFPASSVGPGYTSVWHRSPDGLWTFYQNVEAQVSCPRYFGSIIKKVLQCPIDIEWTNNHSFTVTIKTHVNLSWKVDLYATIATKIMNTISVLIPTFLWGNKSFLKFLSFIASRLLKSGHLGLTGISPNGQSFKANPKKIWMVKSSVAFLDGEDLGPIGPLKNQVRLKDFWIPQRGIFVIGGASFELYDPSKHSLAVSE